MNTLSLHPPKPRTMLGEAFVVALVIEALVLFAIAGWLGRHESKPETKPLPPIRITMAAATPAPPAPRPTPPAPKPVVPHPQPVKQTAPKPRVQRVNPPAPLPKAAQPAEQAEAPDTHPTPVTDKAPAVAPSPPVQPPASSSNAKPSAEFEARLRDAVQAAVRYPSAARIMKLSGHVRLGFLYQDGAISNPHVVQSSGQAMLDKAALAALNDTSFPVPPAELKGHALNLEIVVTFSPLS